MTVLGELSKASRRATRRFPALQYASVWTGFLTIGWLTLLYWGERTLYSSHIKACAWDTWEDWPRDAAPHRLALVADPQLVDPHTYPGRPWPLSSLTESYTDLYMTRNFRLINQRLDPDSVALLGDLLDGAREWAPTSTLPLSRVQELYRKMFWDQRAKDEEERKEQASKEAVKVASESTSVVRGEHDALEQAQHESRSPKSSRLKRSDEIVNEHKTFVYGEKERWKPWAGSKQWSYESDRFGRIFFAHDQLYPNNDRSLFYTLGQLPDFINLDNGARNVSTQQLATSGGKLRRILTSLPGNHDLGFGDGVQLSIRDRYVARYGDPNSVTVFGNHTFVSLDTPSLSAYSQFTETGSQTSAEQRTQLYKIWQPTSDFLKGLSAPVSKVVNETLEYYFPSSHFIPGFDHEVTGLQASDEIKPNLDGGEERFPVVLLTHVPLFRNPDVDCGPFRENGRNLPVSFGYQYQTVVTPSLSSDIIRQVAAVGDVAHIFSGDDHDYCNMTHQFRIGSWDEDTQQSQVDTKIVPEITVKSFSWAMGVRKPAFQLVSLWNPIDQHGRSLSSPGSTIQTHLCLLPDQLSIFIKYGLFCGFTLLVLVLRAVVMVWYGRDKAQPDYELLGYDDDDDNDDSESVVMALPQFRPRVSPPLSERVNGYSSSSRSHSQESKGRQRASSTSTSSCVGNSNSLGVQRSYNARTRSVSPGGATIAASTNPPPPPLPPTITQHPQSDYSPFPPFSNTQELNAVPTSQQRDYPIPPADKLGSHYLPNPNSTQYLDYSSLDLQDDEWHSFRDHRYDSQAKSRRRKRMPEWLRRFLVQFCASVAWVAVPSALFYTWLLRNG